MRASDTALGLQESGALRFKNAYMEMSGARWFERLIH